MNRTESIIRESAKYLKELRQKQGLSHETLAKKAGITRVAISHIEKGRRNPSLHIALRIARALEVSLSDVIRYGEQSSEDLR